jgi:hypothetical protein
MRKLLPVAALMMAIIGVTVTPDTMATADADPITFAPDWPMHRGRTERTICAALAQGWSRSQIVSAAEQPT